MNTKSTIKKVAAIMAVGIIGCATSLAAGGVADFLSSLIPSDVAAALNRDIDLGRLVLDSTNSFDMEICKAAKADSGKPMVVGFELASFVFYNSVTNSTNIYFYSAPYAEMSPLDEIICKGKETSRRATTREIPINFIRLVDPSKKDISAEVDLILGVAPLESPEKRKYVRHSFRFTYRNGWKKD